MLLLAIINLKFWENQKLSIIKFKQRLLTYRIGMVLFTNFALTFGKMFNKLSINLLQFSYKSEPKDSFALLSDSINLIGSDWYVFKITSKSNSQWVCTIEGVSLKMQSCTDFWFSRRNLKTVFKRCLLSAINRTNFSFATFSN